MPDTWDAGDDLPWSGVNRAIVPAHPVFLRAVPGTPAVADDVFFQIEAAEGTPEVRSFYIEKEGMILESSGITPSEMKLITAIYPIIDGTVGSVFTFYIGGEIGQPGFTVQYTGPFTFTIGQTTKIDCLVTCRYPAFKMSTDTLDPFTLEAIGFEFEPIGQD